MVGMERPYGWHNRNKGGAAMRDHLPDRVRKDIVAYAEQYGMEKVILFGSRARGTNHERSDIDLAVSGGNLNGFYWAVEEDAWTLLSFDVVSLEQAAGTELGREIERDGILIYEKI